MAQVPDPNSIQTYFEHARTAIMSPAAFGVFVMFVIGVVLVSAFYWQRVKVLQQGIVNEKANRESAVSALQERLTGETNILKERSAGEISALRIGHASEVEAWKLRLAAKDDIIASLRERYGSTTEKSAKLTTADEAVKTDAGEAE